MENRPDNRPPSVTVELVDLLYLETLLIELVADTGDLTQPQEPIWARNCLMAMLDRVQTNMLPAPQLFPADPHPAQHHPAQ